MCRIAVRYGRVPKRSRERGGSTGGGGLGGGEDGGTSHSPVGFADPSTPDSSDSCGQLQQQQHQQPVQQQQQQAQQQQRDPTESRQLAIYDTILTVSQAHHAHCAYTEEKTRNLVRSPVTIVSCPVI